MEFVCGGLFGRYWNRLKTKGEAIESHDHPEDHVTFLWGLNHVLVETPQPDGSWKIRVDREFAGNGMPEDSVVLVRAQERHKVTALEDNAGHICIFIDKALLWDLFHSEARPGALNV